MQKILIIITGPVCAGKTTLAKALAKNLAAPTISTEDFHRPYLRNLERNLPKAFEDFLSALETKLLGNHTVIAEGLFLKEVRRNRLWRLATDSNAKLVVVTLRISQATLNKRYHERHLLGYESLGIEHALKIREEFAQKPWGRKMDSTELSAKKIAKLIRSDCQQLRTEANSTFRVYFDNTALGGFLGFQEGLVPQWGTEHCLDLCQTLDGLVCAGSAMYVRFASDAIYRNTEGRVETLVSRDSRFGNLFAPFSLEARTLRATSETALRATVEHLGRCAENRELENTLRNILLAGGPRELSRHGNELSERMRQVARGRLLKSSKRTNDLGAVGWFERALGESGDSYKALQRTQTDLPFSGEHYWNAVHRLFRCFLHSAFGREREAAFWSTARRSTIIQVGVHHPLARFQTSTFENTLLEKWRDQHGRLFGLTGLFCQLPMFGAFLIGRLSATKWEWQRFDEEFWNLRTASDVLHLREHLGHFSKCLQDGPATLNEAKRTLRAIEKLGSAIGSELKKDSDKRPFQRQRAKSLAAIGARRLQWLALWVHGADSTETAQPKPIVSTFEDTSPKLEFLKNTPPKVRVNGKLLSLPSNRCYALLLLLAERHTSEKSAASSQADLLKPFVETLNSLPGRCNLRLQGRDENFRDRRCIPALKVASSGVPGKPDTAIASVLTQLRNHLQKIIREASDESQRTAAQTLLECVPAKKKPFQLLRLTETDVKTPPPTSASSCV